MKRKPAVPNAPKRTPDMVPDMVCPLCDQIILAGTGWYNDREDMPHEDVKDCIRHLKFLIKDLREDVEAGRYK